MAKAKESSWKGILLKIILPLVIAVAGIITGAAVNINIENGKTNATIIYSEEEVPAALTDDKGEVVETTEYNGETIPTVDEVDGGMFEDRDTGLSAVEGEYEDLGAAIETFDTSTPEAFRDATLNKCIIANNRYGAQCVSLARSFWWSYANRDVSTCGTGMAKGMMNCADQNAGDEFLYFWGSNGIQDGDWIISDGGQYGHVGMALGPVVNGYVALLGENQGGHKCEGYGGSATNIINFNVKNVIGYYRPKAYIKPEPTPAPQPTPAPAPSNTVTYTYKKGDYFSKVLVKLGLDEKKLWGNDGAVRFYTNQLIQQNVLDRRGNVKIGVPFTLTRR